MWRSQSSSTRFSPPFSMGKWSLREAAYLATACCRFYRRFSPSLRSVHYTCVCVGPSLAQKRQWLSACARCTGSRPLKFTKVCLQRTARATVRFRIRDPSVFACLCVYGRRRTCFGWFMWTAAPVELCSGGRETLPIFSLPKP